MFLKIRRLGRIWLHAIRAHHYIKNFLIFLPLITSHTYVNKLSIESSLIAFFIFCLASSCVYLFNDYRDLEADRLHRMKSRRPLASGVLSVSVVWITGVIFFLGSMGLSLLLPRIFQLFLGLYWILNIIYTCYLKKLKWFDLGALTLFYIIRILAGIAAIQVAYSGWLLMFCGLFFLSLALLKRYIELLFLSSHQIVLPGRNYQKSDLTSIKWCGIICSYLSVMVYACYIYSEQARLLYHHHDWLWGVFFLIFYWISRIWWYAMRARVNDDPILFVLTDWLSLGIVFLVMGVLLLAR